MQVKPHAAWAGHLPAFADDAACPVVSCCSAPRASVPLGFPSLTSGLRSPRAGNRIWCARVERNASSVAHVLRLQANAPASRQYAPNWNFNVSHEGKPHVCSGRLSRG